MSVEPPSSGRPTGPPSGPLSQPPSGPPSQPPTGGGRGAPEPHEPWWRSAPRIALLTTAVVVAVIVAVVLSSSGGGGSAKVSKVFLQSANAAGQDPFTESTAKSGSVAPITPSAAAAVATAPPNQLHSVKGGDPGLYAGTRNNSSCDVGKQIRDLQASPAKNSAFASVVGIRPSAVPAYLRSLTPVQLRVDTRVTDHGYRGGAATDYQAVLQSGTAVLVDGRGVPRVRCVSGNPLTPPVAQRTTPKTTGDHWASYRPSNVVVVRPAAKIIVVFVVFDSHNDKWFHRHRGDQSGQRDQWTSPPKQLVNPWATPYVMPPPPTSTGPTSPTSTGPSSPTSPTSTGPSSPTSPGSTSPSSESPSSESPSSESPSSESPSSESPSGESPSSESPSSEAPSSEPETTSGPTSEPTTEGQTVTESSAPGSPGGSDTEQQQPEATSNAPEQTDTGNAPEQNDTGNAPPEQNDTGNAPEQNDMGGQQS